ncbi:MAG: extracellular solute-binding protein, partial [Pseudomonadota bacterium]
MAFLAVASPNALSEPVHGLAMHGKPALDAGFEALPYVNRTAPKGGTLVMGEVGGFDSLHPFILKGRAPWQIRSLTVESLMARSWDEPFTLYGLLAETIEVPDDRSWVEFTLRKKARFSDGSPVTIEDVIWSFETLGTKGHPRYRNSWRDVASVEASGPRTVRITFATRNRELPLIMGLRPILKAGQWDETAFDQPPEGAVIGSGPYVISSHESGRFLEFSRNPDWWGQDLPVNRGLHNFDRIRIEYFRNDEAYWEAVKTGAISLHAEYDPVRWSEGYDVPAVTSGALVLDELEHRRPSGLSGFVFNTRREI